MLTFENLSVNRTRREVLLNDAPLQLKPQEYQLLLFFAEHRGQMLSREFILERVWGWDFIGDSRTVDVLNALAVAGISNVTFTVSEEE